MKKLILAAMAAVLLLTAACAGNGKLDLEDLPRHTPKPAAPVSTPALTEPSGVFTNWSHLTEYAPPENLYSRLQAGPMEKLAPSKDHGRLLPFEGESVYSAGEYAWQVGSKYGLVTMDGCIVLDPVCSNIYRLSNYDYAGNTTTYYDMLVLEKTVYDPETAYDEWNRGYTTVYALAALDGSWVTDFAFSSIYGSAAGAICCRDYEENLAVCYGEDGGVVFDTADWPLREQMENYTLYSLMYYAEGYAPVQLKDGSWVFVDLQGGTLDAADGERLDWAYGFSCGVAAVEVDGLMGYIDKAGQWAVEPQYRYVNNFSHDRAIVTTPEGTCYAIDPTGRRLYEFPGDAMLEPTEDGGYCYYVYIDNESKYYDENFELVTIGGQPAKHNYGAGFFAMRDDGITVMADGRELFIPGADGVTRCGDLFIAIEYDETSYTYRGLLLDKDGNILLEAENGSFSQIVDDVTGERYITKVSDAGGQSVYSMAGELLVSDYTYGEMVDGLVPCRDAVSTGYKNLRNEWVFRYVVDSAD